MLVVAFFASFCCFCFWVDFVRILVRWVELLKWRGIDAKRENVWIFHYFLISRVSTYQGSIGSETGGAYRSPNCYQHVGEKTLHEDTFGHHCTHTVCGEIGATPKVIPFVIFLFWFSHTLWQILFSYLFWSILLRSICGRQQLVNNRNVWILRWLNVSRLWQMKIIRVIAIMNAILIFQNLTNISVRSQKVLNGRAVSNTNVWSRTYSEL